jgi:hypothetical protein
MNSLRTSCVRRWTATVSATSLKQYEITSSVPAALIHLGDVAARGVHLAKHANELAARSSE